MKFGIDGGNGYFKYHGHKRFASKVRNGVLSKFGKKKEIHTVRFEGDDYVVGDGTKISGTNRYFDKPYKLALLTAIALSSGTKKKTVEADIVIGLPVDHYYTLADSVQQHIENYGVNEITVDGVEYIIEIKSVTVFIESAWVIKEDEDAHTLVIDVGAGTLTAIEWEGQEIVKKYTFNQSFSAMNTTISQYLNEKYALELNTATVEEVIKTNTIFVDDEEVDVSKDIEEIMSAQISEYANTIKDSFNINLCKYIKVIGGGAVSTMSSWKKYFPKAKLVPNSQYVNQEVYEAVANSLDADEE